MFESLASCFAFRCSASLNMTEAFMGEFKRSAQSDMSELEKRPEPVQEVGCVLAFC
jgi:hypothetical protein